MYNLQEAKDEIDTVARHTAVLTEYVFSAADVLKGMLDGLRTDLLIEIDTKFAELRHEILGGEHRELESSAIADLGAKISMLTSRGCG